MQKTKLGLPTGVAAAVIYLLVLFGGYIPALLAVGYVLICESDSWLKKSALKALVIALAFSLVNAVVGLIPDLIDVIGSLFQIFGGYFSISFVNRVYNFFVNVMSVAKIVVLLGMAALALKNKTVDVKPLDSLID